MKIFIEIPTWLGDAVMATPAIENIIKTYPDAQLIIYGSSVSVSLFTHHPNKHKIIIDESKKSRFRYFRLYKDAKSIGEVDIALSFRKNFTSKYLLFFIHSKQKYIYERYTSNIRHQVLRYNDFICKRLNIKLLPDKLQIYTHLKINISKENKKKLLGINPGATYGNAKRWYPEEFAKVIITLSEHYDTIIFGGSAEGEIASHIEQILIKNGIKNYQNMATKTSISDLIHLISSLDLFISNDSGPMHVAAAYQIPTVSIFGPTNHKETNQWMNPLSKIIRIDLECAPCMKRTCPLKHHDCMKQITADTVLNEIQGMSL